MSNPTHEFQKKKATTSGASPARRAECRTAATSGRAGARGESYRAPAPATQRRRRAELVAVAGGGGGGGVARWGWGWGGGGGRRRRAAEETKRIGRLSRSLSGFPRCFPAGLPFPSRFTLPKPSPAPLLLFARRAFNPRARARAAAGFG
ncbi:hypothetical protein GQ55_1G055700 [Panicum hallii var. hallii]|uniref:Uncharacterized protein n=1 Tax=Panicum hallii var. hallii TaxID=1504633 RepID=A0A2T7F2M1_9POAL|nr:hypothetical protein GQ55_1G055700 [Panicum hallii var. hallii]